MIAPPADCEWRVLDWAPDYAVSEYGHVRRIKGSGQGVLIGRILRSQVKKHGHHKTDLIVDGKKTTKHIHRLVCEAWHGPPPFAGAHAAHWDGDPGNNHYTNLRWASARENGADTIRHGRSGRGEQCAASVLDWAQVREIRARFTGARGEPRVLAEQFNVSRATIERVVKHETWVEASPC